MFQRVHFSLDDLLASVDEENELDYDLADDEEAALLEENFEAADSKKSLLLASGTEGPVERGERETDVLDLDDDITLNDEEGMRARALMKTLHFSTKTFVFFAIGTNEMYTVS